MYQNYIFYKTSYALSNIRNTQKNTIFVAINHMMCCEWRTCRLTNWYQLFTTRRTRRATVEVVIFFFLIFFFWCLAFSNFTRLEIPSEIYNMRLRGIAMSCKFTKNPHLTKIMSEIPLLWVCDPIPKLSSEYQYCSTIVSPLSVFRYSVSKRSSKVSTLNYICLILCIYVNGFVLFCSCLSSILILRFSSFRS